MRWAMHVARMGRGEGHTGFWWGNLRERNRLEELDVDVKIILKLKWFTKKCDADEWTGLIWVRMGRGGWRY